jgi:hypothetical protein
MIDGVCIEMIRGHAPDASFGPPARDAAIPRLAVQIKAARRYVILGRRAEDIAP